MDRQVNPGFGDGFLVPGHPFRDVVAHADNEYMDAPRGPVELEESDELERLRRRAYGPDADIAGDAAAQARLSELEAAQRRQLTPVGDAAGVPAPIPERVPVAETVEGSRSASTSVPQPVGGRSPSMSVPERRSSSKTPPRGRPPIPTPSTEPPRYRGGAAAAR